MRRRQYAPKPAQDTSVLSSEKLLQTRPFQPEIDKNPPVPSVQASVQPMPDGFDLTKKVFVDEPPRPQTAGPLLQAKLTIGEPNDKYEQEADRVAHDVVQRIHETDNGYHPLGQLGKHADTVESTNVEQQNGGKNIVQCSGGSSKANEELKNAMGKSRDLIDDDLLPNAKPHTKKGTGSSGTDHQGRNAAVINQSKQKMKQRTGNSTMFQSSQMRTATKQKEKDQQAQEKRMEKQVPKQKTEEIIADELGISVEEYRSDREGYRQSLKDINPELYEQLYGSL